MPVLSVVKDVLSTKQLGIARVMRAMTAHAQTVAEKFAIMSTNASPCAKPFVAMMVSSGEEVPLIL